VYNTHWYAYADSIPSHHEVEEVGRHDICIEPFRESSPMKCSECHVLMRDHTDLLAAHTTIHEWNETSLPQFAGLLQCQVGERSKTDAARITNLNVQMFHNES